MAIHSIWEKFPELQQELLETQKIMNQEVTIRNKEISRALQSFFANGGKLLRPAFFLLFTKFGEVPSNKRKYQYAAAIEILHAATLVHDDIIDEAPVRRNMATIQSLYGKDIAVYTGDFLFTVYFQLVTQATRDYNVLDFNAKNMRHILIGELDQMHLRHNPNITVKEYLRHVKGKTAQLFQLSCAEGARFSGCSKIIQLRAYRIGHDIGMAFQILDDILDFTADEEVLQKPVLEDIQNGNYTLPLILAMKNNREAFDILRTNEDLSEDDVKEILANIKRYDGIKEAQSMAKRYTDSALKEINKLPNVPAKAILKEITQQLLQRDY